MSGVFRKIVVGSHGDGPDPELRSAAVQVAADDANIESFHVATEGHRRRETLDGLLGRVMEAEADLLVIGGRSHVMAARAAMMASCSILMVPDNTKLTIGRVMVPVDFSGHAREALLVARDVVRQHRGEIEIVCVFVESEDAPWHSIRDEVVEHAHKLTAVQDFVQDVLGTVDGVRCLAEPLDRSGARVGSGFSLAHAIEGADVASTIEIAAAREKADLIVVGTRGRTASAAVLLGSVTEKVMQFAQRPVLAVKRRGANLGILELLVSAAHDRKGETIRA